MNVILASASPRRRELLGYIYKDFEVLPSDVDENIPADISVFEAAEYLAVKKAAFIAENHADSLVIGCDTVVISDGKILGKPKDKLEAFEMLSSLSGKTHKVCTGVALFYAGKSLSFTDETSVTFYNLSAKEIEEYIASGNPFDKAGAYGIQDEEFLPVKGIIGDYFNVVGLPIGRIKRTIKLFLKEN